MFLNDWIIVFDLDDTLISEIDYLHSGIKYIEKFIYKTYKVDFTNNILNEYENGTKDIWGWTCKELNIGKEAKDNLIWLYRLHPPELTLSKELLSLINFLKEKKATLAILTEGRSVTQRLKINSIQLHKIPLFISQEFNSTKKQPEMFLEIQKIWPNKKYAYIADNPKKDFIIPNKLNWLSIGADWIKPRLYSESKLISDNQPKFWATDPNQIISIFS